MKKLNFTFLLSILMSMVGLNASAHDIEVKNADGVTIYYNYINNNTELAVTYRGTYSSEYEVEYYDDIVIPESVTYNEKTYSVTSIAERAFYDCSPTSITIPNSVTSIGDAAFYFCSGLTSITIPNSVTSIGECAFSESGFTSVTIGNSVTSIGDQAFSGCIGLTSVTIGNSVTSIGWDTFYGCSGLTSITIPNSVTSIGSGAFASCSGLTSIYSYIESPTSDTGSNFDISNYTDATLYVPYGTKAKYQTTAGWNNFKKIQEMDNPSAINGVNAEDAKSFVGKIIKDNKIIIMKNGKKHSVSGQGM